MITLYVLRYVLPYTGQWLQHNYLFNISLSHCCTNIHTYIHTYSSLLLLFYFHNLQKILRRMVTQKKKKQLKTLYRLHVVAVVAVVADVVHWRKAQLTLLELECVCILCTVVDAFMRINLGIYSIYLYSWCRYFVRYIHTFMPLYLQILFYWCGLPFSFLCFAFIIFTHINI